MTLKKPDPSIVLGLCLFVLLCLSNEITAQCAGTDNTVTVCDKDQDDTTKNYTLFDKLGGSPILGGTWSTNDPANFFALNRNTGEINLWEVKNSGVHEFTYTNNACAESAVITINLGGYPGEDNTDGSADACGDDSSVNLHSFIGDETEGKFQDFNGTWAAVTPTAAPHLNQNIFDAQSAGTGIYEFTHTVPAVATCPSRQVSLILEVQRPANSGIGSNLTVCTTDDLSGLTNYNLNDLLTDEDVNGTWSEGPSTNQLDDLTDNTIDIEAIRNNHTQGGTFTFTYTVFPAHAVCEKNQTVVELIILPTLQGTMQAANYCVGPPQYRVAITNYNDVLIPSGPFDISYALASASGTVPGMDTMILRNDRTGVIEVDANLVTLNEITTLTITSVSGACPDIQVPPISFLVTDPIINIANTCEGQDLQVSLSNIFEASLNRASGNYDITYVLQAPSGSETIYNLNALAFASGVANFTIPAAQVAETGNYGVSIEVASGFPLDCEITTSVAVTPIPQAIDLNLIVDNSCDATKINVLIDAPILADGAYAVVYEVFSQETNTVLIDNSINFTGGTAEYEIDVAPLPQGNYTVAVRSSQNDTTPCRLDFDFELNENFAIQGIPTPPSAESQQMFCLSAFIPETPTLQDIEVSADGQIMFYATATDMNILPLDTELLDGEDYYLSNIDPDNNCEGSERIQVTVSLADPEPPTALDTNPTFCGPDNPTITSLNTSIDNGVTVIWFETASGGTALEATTTLIDGKSYFAATEANDRCQSIQRLEIVPTVYALEPASLQFTTLGLCGLDNPVVANLQDAESNNSYDVLWYDTPEKGIPLSELTRLEENTIYYAESFNPDTGCINPERIAIALDLSDCNPEDYGFFVPDGFSPNGDGRNDTFFIPNIEIIFPDFTLEILNRYGSTLFKGDKNKPAWDGSNSSGIAPNGVYFYIIDYQKTEHSPIQGRLYLNR